MSQDDLLQSSGLIGDQPTKDDYLGFQPYVLAVAAFLTDAGTIPPLTLSVEREWGSGKSSFLKQLKEELSKQRNPFFSVSFNPWRYSENEALWAAFAIEFERQNMIKRNGGKKQNLDLSKSTMESSYAMCLKPYFQ